MSDFLGIDLVAGLDQAKTVSEINGAIGRIAEDPKLNKIDLKININDEAIKSIKEISKQIKQMGTDIDKLNAKLRDLGVSKNTEDGIKKQVNQIKQVEQATNKAGITATEVNKRQQQEQEELNRAIAKGNALKKETIKLDERGKRIGVTREYSLKDGNFTKREDYGIDKEGKEILLGSQTIDNRHKVYKSLEQEGKRHNQQMSAIAKEREKIARMLNKAESMYGANSKVISGFRNKMAVDGNDITYYKSLTKNVDRYTASLKGMTDAERIRLAQQKASYNIAKLERAVGHRTPSSKHQEQLKQYLNNMMALNTNMPDWQQKLSRYSAEFSNLRDEIVYADQGLARFSKQMASAMLRVPIYAATIGTMYAPMRMFQDALRQTIEIDSQLTVLERVSNGTIEMNSALQESIGIAERLGNVISEVNDGLIAFARQGYRGDELTAMTETATLMSNVSDLTVDDSASSLTAAMKGFNIEAENSMHIVNAMNEVDNNYAITTQQLAQAIERSAGTAQVYGKMRAA